MPITSFLDPKNDFVFKQIFGTEKNKDILISFLNDILSLGGKDIVTSVTFQKTQQDPDIPLYRKSIVDVLCKSQDGVQFVVEMQIGEHQGFEKRAQFYAAKAYSKQALKEDGRYKRLDVYAKLKKVIFIAIAGFTIFPNKESYYSDHRLKDIKTSENDLKDLRFIFIELPKFKKKLHELSNIQEKWAYFFKLAHQSSLKDIEHLAEEAPAMRRAFEAIDQASWNEAELNSYEEMEKTLLDNAVVEATKIAKAEAKAEARGEARGVEKGREEGMEKGMEKGREEGMEKGKAERDVEIAKSMLREGYSAEQIARITGLSISQIEALKKR